MSALSWLSVAGSIVISAAIIMLVHSEQEKDRIRLHQGVINDQERQARKLQNRRDLEEQTKLREYLEKRDENDDTSQ